jgi:cyclohexanecarboxylate-CoA ligase
LSTGFLLRPSPAAAQRFREAGLWRDSGWISDLRRFRSERPEAPAIKAYRADGGTTLLDYGEYAHRVERFAGALYELGVRPGQVVACQLPNWWQAAALMLAATRLQAVLAPIMTTIRPRELERVLHRVGASVCVTVDEWAGSDHAAALREVAPRLPQLRHRVVMGEPAEGEIEFRSFFEETPWEQRHPVALDDAQEDPDRVSLVLFTSGTSGEPKGVLHTDNTRYATVSRLVEPLQITPEDAIFTPHALMHGTAQTCSRLALVTGACVILLDSWSGERGVEVLARSETTHFAAAPSFISDTIEATGGKPPVLPRLRMVSAGSTTIPKPLVRKVRDVFGVALRTGWGMTEIGIATTARSDDPPDWATCSDGRPTGSVEVDLRSDGPITADRPARVFVRGAAVCLATVGRDSGTLTVIAEQNDGWFDTGDLAVPDGRDGVRLMGRAGDRIGGVFMIPVNDVESALLIHPGVRDVALVGYPDDTGGELACAVISPATAPSVTLEELRTYLLDQGMTEWYLPSRLEYAESLPRNDSGKVRKELLRRWLQGEADRPA